ncbi:MAG TPA: metallophosphoesterase [Candidatus Acidoferrales bacterium]|nr:metallophosphoesterase [Candidatus Acidoferrales bacterium]
MRTRIIFLLATVQALLFASHWFVYRTWTALHPAAVPALDPPGVSWLGVATAFLSVTFITASLLAWRYSALPVRVYYTSAAVWLGFFNFYFLAACASWIFYGLASVLRVPGQREHIAFLFFGIATAAGAYGLVNSMRVRVRRVAVKLTNLPAIWRGRIAALVTDTHLGHVRGVRFAERVVSMVSRLRPDIVLIGGDLYDGTAADDRKLAAPLSRLSPPLGTYFIAGNHEAFGDRSKYFEAVAAAGVRVLDNEKVVLDGLQLVGVHHRDAARPDRLRAILQNARLDRNSASVLLTHAPDQPAVAADEGIGLMLAGHTHGGQFFPYTWFTSRIYGALVHGLNRLGSLHVYTSSGAGTWGPPLRVGTNPEIVLLTFDESRET